MIYRKERQLDSPAWHFVKLVFLLNIDVLSKQELDNVVLAVFCCEMGGGDVGY